MLSKEEYSFKFWRQILFVDGIHRSNFITINPVTTIKRNTNRILDKMNISPSKSKREGLTARIDKFKMF